jgi:hypothetical protein
MFNFLNSMHRKFLEPKKHEYSCFQFKLTLTSSQSQFPDNIQSS